MIGGLSVNFISFDPTLQFLLFCLYIFFKFLLISKTFDQDYEKMIKTAGFVQFLALIYNFSFVL